MCHQRINLHNHVRFQSLFEYQHRNKVQFFFFTQCFSFIHLVSTSIAEQQQQLQRVIVVVVEIKRAALFSNHTPHFFFLLLLSLSWLLLLLRLWQRITKHKKKSFDVKLQWQQFRNEVDQELQVVLLLLFPSSGFCPPFHHVSTIKHFVPFLNRLYRIYGAPWYNIDDKNNFYPQVIFFLTFIPSSKGILRNASFLCIYTGE